MNSRIGIEKITMIGVLVAAFIALISLPIQALAQDTDRDGYLDAEEANTQLKPYGMNSYFPVDPLFPDAFVILDPASAPSPPSRLPTGQPYWYQAMTKEQSQGGLGLKNVNVIMQAQGPNADRFITYLRQRAGKITEDTFNAVGDELGWCQQGTFNDEDNCIVYTERIVNHIKLVCGNRYGGPNCKDQSGNIGDALVRSYVTWVMVHELGHSMTIERCYIETNGGNHTPTNTGYIMDQSVYAEDRRGVVTFKIPNIYSTESKSGFDLAIEKDSSVCEAITTGKKR